MNDGTLDHALEAGCGFCVLIEIGDQVGQFGIDVIGKRAAQLVGIDIAGAHDGCRVLVVHQRQKQMLKRCIFLTALIGEGQCLVEGFFQAIGE